jgi:hypothetical protein
MTPHTGKIQAALAIVVTVGFFVVLYLIMKENVDRTMRDALLIMIGALGAGFAQVLSFYFGSSTGSAQKNAIIAAREAPKELAGS